MPHLSRCRTPTEVPVPMGRGGEEHRNILKHVANLDRQLPARGAAGHGCAATARPALHPGARSWVGGPRLLTSWPLRASNQDVSELEFHMSPVCASSRPQVSTGT